MKRFIRIFGLLLLSFALVGAALMDIPSWEKLNLEKITNADASSVLLTADGTPFARLRTATAGEKLRADEIPETVRQAFLAAEDSRFYEHSGVDVRRMLGALWLDLRTLSFREGASTITQQLVKLTHLSGKKTISRKTNEIALALQLERRMSKDEILAAYLNTVYFGEGAYGVESAAQIYFGKSAADLNAAEAALLAGIVKAPSAYSPFDNPAQAQKRRAYVLSRMEALGYLSEDEEAKMQSLPLPETRFSESDECPWYRDEVLREACERLNVSADELLSGGYTIFTALNPKAQASAEALFESASAFPADAADGTKAQAAFCAVDPETGAIRALVGGRDYAVRRGLNRATQSRRQPGSTFKPVSVYAAAVDALGLSPSSILDDSQRTFDGQYTPSNAGGKYHGLVTMRAALAHSYNAASVSLIEFTGVDLAREYAMRMGLPLSDSDSYLSLALGSLTYGVTPAELTAAYAALANGGRAVQAHTVEKILDRNGRTVYEFTPSLRRVMTEESAYLITSMLTTAATSGSASALSRSGVSIAGKTGTAACSAAGNRDIWTVAYTPDLVACAWMGFDSTDDQHMLPASESGSGKPARLLAAFFRENASGARFSVPDGITTVRLDRQLLNEGHVSLLAPADAPQELTISEVFVSGHEPTRLSDALDAPETPGAPVLERLPDDIVRVRAEDGSNANVDYLVVRQTAEGHEIRAVLTEDAPAFEEPVEPGELAYALIARSRRLYEAGVTRLSDIGPFAALPDEPSLSQKIRSFFAR